MNKDYSYILQSKMVSYHCHKLQYLGRYGQKNKVFWVNVSPTGLVILITDNDENRCFPNVIQKKSLRDRWFPFHIVTWVSLVCPFYPSTSLICHDNRIIPQQPFVWLTMNSNSLDAFNLCSCQNTSGNRTVSTGPQIFHVPLPYEWHFNSLTVAKHFQILRLICSTQDRLTMCKAQSWGWGKQGKKVWSCLTGI